MPVLSDGLNTMGDLGFVLFVFFFFFFLEKYRHQKSRRSAVFH